MVYPHTEYQGPAYPDVLHSTTDGEARELDSRVADGIEVRLLWHAGRDRVSVAVHDTKTGEAFELPVGDGQRAIDVYHHPYAYAANRRGRDHASSSVSLVEGRVWASNRQGPSDPAPHSAHADGL